MTEALGANERLRGGPSELLASTAFSHELDGTDCLFGDMNLADMAHLAELHRIGICTDEERKLIGSGLLHLVDSGADAVPWDPSIGDIYNNRTAYLESRIGQAIGHIHTGRARREATTTAWHLVCRRRLLELKAAVCDLAQELVFLGERESSTWMTDFTYLQHAQPTTLGHYLLGFVGPLLRDLARIDLAYSWVNQSPAGSGSVNGTAISLDRYRLAESLGFPELVLHTRDAMWAADIAVDVGVHALLPLVTGARLVEDLFVWSTAEFGYFEPADEHSRTSVIMPQKKNPYALAYLRGAVRSAVGMSTSIINTQLTPSGQPDSRTTSYVMVPELLEEARNSLLLLSEVMHRGEFRAERMAAQVMTGHTYATDLCDYLVSVHPIDNRMAHRVVGTAVRLAFDRGYSTITEELFVEAATQSEVNVPWVGSDVMSQLGNAEELIEWRKTTGGAARPSFELMASNAANRIQDHRSSIARERSRVAQAEQRLVDLTRSNS